MSRQPALFFDLDGTLTDSSPGILNCLVHAMEALDRPVPPPAELRATIGPPLQETLLSWLGDETLAQRGLQLYRERFAEKGLFENALYPGVESLLGQLADEGYRLFLATSKPEVFARRILQHFRIADCFSEIFGARLDGRLADKTELLDHALTRTGVNPGHAIMIGDRRHDVLGARANGLRAIGVLYGYGSREELEDAGAEWLADSPAGIAERVASAGPRPPA